MFRWAKSITLALGTLGLKRKSKVSARVLQDDIGWVAVAAMRVNPRLPRLALCVVNATELHRAHGHDSMLCVSL
jgi:hypothetical protein